MATKTMILRPTSISSPSTSLISFVPSSVNINSAHSLINESISDDDSGYIICSAGGQVNSYFNYSRPSDMINITGVSIKIRCKLESSQTSKVLNNSFIISSIFSATNITNITTDYVDYELSFGDSYTTIIEELNSIEQKLISIESSISSGSKYSPIRITQIFIEITYDARADVIYQKINGTWDKLPKYQLYQFSNDNWNLSTNIDDILYNGKRYILQSKLEEVSYES